MVKDIIAKLSKSTEPAIRTSVGENEFGLYEGDIVALLPLSTPAIVGRLLSARQQMAVPRIETWPAEGGLG